MEEQKEKMIDATETFYESIKKLCDDSFGTGYLDYAEFTKWLLHPGLFKIALIDGEFAGYSVMIPAKTEVIMEHMGMEESEVMEITENKPALIYKSAAVLPKYRKHGLFTKLAESLLCNAKELGYCSVIVSAWTHSGRTPVEKSLMSLDFTRLYRRHMLWYQYENYRCVICNGRCVCDAIIFYKKIEGENQ